MDIYLASILHVSALTLQADIDQQKLCRNAKGPINSLATY